uniref:Phosphorylase b kinase regulatory subunit n=1 Tax=Ascaris lumbricoides TaxID=6252 RepID=A0A0M3HP99_ASCLU
MYLEGARLHSADTDVVGMVRVYGAVDIAVERGGKFSVEHCMDVVLRKVVRQMHRRGFHSFVWLPRGKLLVVVRIM